MTKFLSIILSIALILSLFFFVFFKNAMSVTRFYPYGVEYYFQSPFDVVLDSYEFGGYNNMPPNDRIQGRNIDLGGNLYAIYILLSDNMKNELSIDYANSGDTFDYSDVNLNLVHGLPSDASSASIYEGWKNPIKARCDVSITVYGWDSINNNKPIITANVSNIELPILSANIISLFNNNLVTFRVFVDNLDDVEDTFDFVAYILDVGEALFVLFDNIINDLTEVFVT